MKTELTFGGGILNVVRVKYIRMIHINVGEMCFIPMNVHKAFVCRLGGIGRVASTGWHRPGASPKCYSAYVVYHFYMHTVQLPNVDECRDLVVFVDSHCNFKQHISHICRKALCR